MQDCGGLISFSRTSDTPLLTELIQRLRVSDTLIFREAEVTHRVKPDLWSEAQKLIE